MQCNLVSVGFYLVSFRKPFSKPDIFPNALNHVIAQHKSIRKLIYVNFTIVSTVKNLLF